MLTEKKREKEIETDRIPFISMTFFFVCVSRLFQLVETFFLGPIPLSWWCVRKGILKWLVKTEPDLCTVTTKETSGRRLALGRVEPSSDSRVLLLFRNVKKIRASVSSLNMLTWKLGHKRSWHSLCWHFPSCSQRREREERVQSPTEGGRPDSETFHERIKGVPTEMYLLPLEKGVMIRDMPCREEGSPERTISFQRGETISFKLLCACMSTYIHTYIQTVSLVSSWQKERKTGGGSLFHGVSVC